MKKGQNLYIKIFFLILIVATVGIVVSNPQYLKEMWAAVASMNTRFIVFAFLAVVACWFMESLILYVIADRQVGLVACIKIVLAGQFFNAVTPFATGGQPAQLYMLHKENLSISSSASILTRKFIFFQSVLVLISIAVVFLEAEYFIARVPSFAYIGLLGFSLNFFVILTLYMIGYQYHRTRKVTVRLVRYVRRFVKKQTRRKKLLSVVSAIRSFHEKMEQGTRRQSVVLLAFLTFLQLMCFFSIPVIISAGLNLTDLDLLHMISAAAFVTMVTSFIPLPGAAVGAEGSFYLFFGIFIPSHLVLTALIIWRFITFYLPLGVGGVVVLKETVSK